MNGDYPPLPFRKGERKRNRFSVVVAPVKFERHMAGSQVNDLTEAAIVVDDCGKITTWGTMQAPFQDVPTPGLAIVLRSEMHSRKGLPHAGVSVEPSDQSVVRSGCYSPRTFCNDRGNIDDLADLGWEICSLELGIE
jgi:hypothetical protein